ncbi:MAG: Holliday junction branch migration protein RuvA [Clostridia bacterium]|nr:Holliday junction branch migration protein RuvA [Clostridia bacterium]
MIGYLKGKVKYLSPESVLLETGGIGYEVVCSGAAFSRLSGVKQGEDGEVYTYLQVKEDGITLFGFADVQEKGLFLKLTSVQGVGAKMAISILSSMRPSEVSEAIATADSKRFAGVKGVGKKTADRIILELHGKISADELLGGESAGAVSAKTYVSAEDDDALEALIGLGFTRQESARAVERAKSKGAKTVEEILTVVLKG